MKHLLLLLLLAGACLASPIRLDDPPPGFVKLSDGRIVPYGPGVICSDECVNSAAEADPDITPSKKRWLLAIPLVALGLLFIPDGDCPKPMLPPAQPPTHTPIPEPALLIPMGVVFALLAGSLRKKK